MHRVVPELITDNYRKGRYSGQFEAVGLFLDLSGFSTMTDTLMQQGQHGAEVLAGMMHSVFDPLVQSILNYGGEIIGFAGDGVMALYPVESDSRTAALRALASASEIQQRLEADPARQTIYGKFQFSIKIGLTVGAVAWGTLRSKDGDKATYFFRGSAVDESANAEHQASAGGCAVRARLTPLLLLRGGACGGGLVVLVNARPPRCVRDARQDDAAHFVDVDAPFLLVEHLAVRPDDDGVGLRRIPFHPEGGLGAGDVGGLRVARRRVLTLEILQRCRALRRWIC